jgi:hypothetical protein
LLQKILSLTYIRNLFKYETVENFVYLVKMAFALHCMETVMTPVLIAVDTTPHVLRTVQILRSEEQPAYSLAGE